MKAPKVVIWSLGLLALGCAGTESTGTGTGGALRAAAPAPRAAPATGSSGPAGTTGNAGTTGSAGSTTAGSAGTTGSAGHHGRLRGHDRLRRIDHERLRGHDRFGRHDRHRRHDRHGGPRRHHRLCRHGTRHRRGRARWHHRHRRHHRRGRARRHHRHRRHHRRGRRRERVADVQDADVADGLGVRDHLGHDERHELRRRDEDRAGDPGRLLGGRSGSTNAIFEVADGGSVKNVIFGTKVGDGIHCLGSCTIDNVWFPYVCDDAITMLGGSGKTATIEQRLQERARQGDPAQRRRQHRHVRQHLRRDRGQAVPVVRRGRGCGPASSKRTVTASNIYAIGVGQVIGVSSNDKATLKNICAYRRRRSATSTSRAATRTRPSAPTASARARARTACTPVRTPTPS